MRQALLRTLGVSVKVNGVHLFVDDVVTDKPQIKYKKTFGKLKCTTNTTTTAKGYSLPCPTVHSYSVRVQRQVPSWNA